MFSTSTGREKAMGVLEFVMKKGPLTLTRMTGDPKEGWKVFVTEGMVEDNPATTFGAYGWCKIPGLQKLYREVLLRHFPHHVAIVRDHVGEIIEEALGDYLGMKIYNGK